MKYNQLGRTGLFVSEICLGAMTFGRGFPGASQRSAALDQSTTWTRLSVAPWTQGVNFIDTADVYFDG